MIDEYLDTEKSYNRLKEEFNLHTVRLSGRN